MHAPVNPLLPALPPPVVVDLYRDVHKGIRAELFAVATAAGCLDPADLAGRAALATRASGAVDLLEHHAHHEDVAGGPALERHLPDLAATVVADHARFEGAAASLLELASAAADPAAAEPRRLLDGLHLGWSRFVSDYLAHQDLEEREIMPALEAAIGPDETFAIHQAIVGSIDPPVLLAFLAVMLPAMNVEDRTELLAGMQQGAPPEAFEAVVDLARRVTPGGEHAVLVARLGL